MSLSLSYVSRGIRPAAPLRPTVAPAPAPMVRVVVGGRIMLEDGAEYPATMREASLARLVVASDAPARPGERIIGYFEGIGRIEGHIECLDSLHLTIACAHSMRKRDRMAAHLIWLANGEALGLAEERRYERLLPRDPRITLRREGEAPDQAMRAHLIDLSRSGAAVAVPGAFDPGERVILGSTIAMITRCLEGGIAVAFEMLIPAELFGPDIVL